MELVGNTEAEKKVEKKIEREQEMRVFNDDEADDEV